MEAVKQKAEKLSLEKNITFVGNVGNANEWYQAFDCFVLPSIWEGLPVVGVEAQAADLPCVFSANVTREIGFSERAEFVGLDEPLNKWARTIGKALLQTDRVDRTDLITESTITLKWKQSGCRNAICNCIRNGVRYEDWNFDASLHK